MFRKSRRLVEPVHVALSRDRVIRWLPAETNGLTIREVVKVVVENPVVEKAGSRILTNLGEMNHSGEYIDRLRYFTRS